MLSGFSIALSFYGLVADQLSFFIVFYKTHQLPERCPCPFVVAYMAPRPSDKFFLVEFSYFVGPWNGPFSQSKIHVYISGVTLLVFHMSQRAQLVYNHCLLTLVLFVVCDFDHIGIPKRHEKFQTTYTCNLIYETIIRKIFPTLQTPL